MKITIWFSGQYRNELLPEQVVCNFEEEPQTIGDAIEYYIQSISGLKACLLDKGLYNSKGKLIAVYLKNNKVSSESSPIEENDFIRLIYPIVGG